MFKNTQNNTNIPLAALLAGQTNDNYICTTQHTYNQYTVFLDKEIIDPEYYRELIALLFAAGPEDSFTFIINSPGGSIDSAMAIIEGLKSTQAETTAVIMGRCHSAASIIMLYCDQIIVMDSGYAMIHHATFGSAGMASNVKAHTEFTVNQVERILEETYSGFLHKDEIVKVRQGLELWMDAEEIRRRIEGRVKWLKAKIRQTQKNENKQLPVNTD